MSASLRPSPASPSYSSSSRPQTPIRVSEPSLRLPMIDNKNRDREEAKTRPLTYIVACEVPADTEEEAMVDICVEFDSDRTRVRHEADNFIDVYEIISHIVREKHNKELDGLIEVKRAALTTEKVDMKLTKDMRDKQ